MTDKERIDFYERWIKALDNLDSNVRGKVNAQCIAFTGMYIGVNVNGLVTIETTENDRWKKEL